MHQIDLLESDAKIFPRLNSEDLESNHASSDFSDTLMSISGVLDWNSMSFALGIRPCATPIQSGSWAGSDGDADEDKAKDFPEN